MRTPRLRFIALAALAVLLITPTMAAAQTPVAVEEDTAVRIMSYNIKHARGNDDCVNPTAAPDIIPEAECEVDLERIADVIRASEADIVNLQEVDRFWARSGGVDQPAELAAMLDMNVCYGANLQHEPDEHSDVAHEYGTAVLTAFDIEGCVSVYLPTTDGWEQRGVQLVTLRTPADEQIFVANTHLQAGREGEEAEAVRQREAQLQEVLYWIQRSDMPVIVTGDFNARPGDAEMAAIEAGDSGFTDARMAADSTGDGFTIPASPSEDATGRIDYIWVNAGFEVQQCEVVVNDSTRIAADHYPVVADLVLRQHMVEPVAPQATPLG